MPFYSAMVEIKITDPDGSYAYKKTVPPFVVLAPSLGDAATMAVQIASASASPRDLYRSRGSVVALDSDHEPIGYPREWDDFSGDDDGAAGAADRLGDPERVALVALSRGRK